MDAVELTALLEQHEKRGLIWVTISTKDLRELLDAHRKPQVVDYSAMVACMPLPTGVKR